MVCDMLLGVGGGSGEAGAGLEGGGRVLPVDSSEVFVIPYLIVRLTAIKMFNLRI